jgi:predicted lipoprotein
MGSKPKIFISVTIAEKALIGQQAAQIGVSESAYGYIKLFGSNDRVRTAHQKHVHGQVGSAINAARRIEGLAQMLAADEHHPKLDELLAELDVLKRHLHNAHNHLLGDLGAG